MQSRFEAIPGPAAEFYNLTAAKLLRKPENKIAADVIAAIKNGSVLDIGCGTGFLAIEIAKKSPQLKVYGIDLSSQMVKISRRHAKGLENTEFILSNAAALPFEDRSIDFIVSTGSLHHWKNPDKVFADCYRILKDGGQAWIYDPCYDAVQVDIKGIKKRYGTIVYLILTKVTRMHGFSKEEYEGKIKALLDNSGFKDNYHMQLTDLWMKVTLKKQPI